MRKKDNGRKWNSKIDTKNMILETEMEGKRKDFELIDRRKPCGDRDREI